MLFKLLVFLAFSAFVTYVRSDEDDTMNLGDDDFDSSIATFDTSLVMFYAPWYVLEVHMKSGGVSDE